MDAAKLYPIAPDGDKFDEMSRYFSGVVAGGEQVLVAQASPIVCAHRFTADGRYLGRECRTTDWCDGLSWAKELGLIPKTIQVLKFSTFPDPGPLLGIFDQPSWFADGALGSEEEEERTLRWWREIGGFVLRWAGKEYTLDGRGVRFQ